MELSFIILSWNSARFLEGVLGSIQRDLAETGWSYEILVIDNGSKDDSLAALRQWQARGLPLTVIPLGHNTGTTFSRNIGLRMARGRYVCVLDSDIEFCDVGTLRKLTGILESRPDAGLIAPLLCYPSGNHQKSFDQFPTISNKLKRLFFLRAMEKSEGQRTFSPDEQLEVNYVISAFWLFRRELLDEIGLLDENIFYAPEDVDFCLRTWLAGLKVLYCPSAKVIHRAQEITRKRPFSKAALSHLNGLAYYFRKHGYAIGLKRIARRIATAVAARKP